MKLKLNTLLFFVLSLVILTSCGSGPKKETIDLPKSLDKQITDLISSEFPKPSNIPYDIMQTGADYNQSLINSRESIENYISQPDKAALNLGSYAADMGYLVAYEKTQESIDYFQACKRIADELGIMGSFSPEIAQKVETNIGNRDVLTSILDSAVLDASKYMNNNSQSKLGALIVTGSFVESLYLATGIVKTYPKATFSNPAQRIQVLTPLMSLIIKQRKSVSEVINMLKKVDQTESVTKILTDFSELEASYSKLVPLEEQITKGDPKLAFNDETLTGITKTIEKIRADIVN